MTILWPNPSPRVAPEQSILATVPRQQDRLRGCIEKQEIHLTMLGGEAAWNWILLGAHESEPVKNA